MSGVQTDSRFIPKMDDPNGIESDSPAKEILAVPILLEGEEKSGNFVDLPKAVLLLINRRDGAPFSQDDNDYVCSYAPLIGRALDVI